MLDRDLALLYECANGTKTINQAVKRNIERFPGDFYFQLTSDETKYLWSQVGTAKSSKTRTLPYAFTEQGIAMLASVLRTKKKTNIKSLDLKKYNTQYHNLKIIYNETFHDRYIIIDKQKIYHLGASINYAGSRTFSINILEDKLVKKTLIDNIIALI